MPSTPTTHGGLHTFPILFTNLTAEMMYVLDERLSAQKLPAQKHTQILAELITGALLYLHRDQEEEEKRKKKDKEIKRNCSVSGRCWYSRIFTASRRMDLDELKEIFCRIGESSTVEIDSVSMGKLYELMLMMNKYQLERACTPFEILDISINHILELKRILNRLQKEHNNASSGEEVDPTIQSCEILLQEYHVAFLTHFSTVVKDILAAASTANPCSSSSSSAAAAVALSRVSTFFRQLDSELHSFFHGRFTKIALLMEDRVQDSHGRFLHPGRMDRCWVDGDGPYNPSNNSATLQIGKMRIYDDGGRSGQRESVTTAFADGHGAGFVYAQRPVKGDVDYSVKEVAAAPASSSISSDTANLVSPAMRCDSSDVCYVMGKLTHSLIKLAEQGGNIETLLSHPPSSRLGLDLYRYVAVNGAIEPNYLMPASSCSLGYSGGDLLMAAVGDSRKRSSTSSTSSTKGRIERIGHSGEAEISSLANLMLIESNATKANDPSKMNEKVKISFGFDNNDDVITFGQLLNRGPLPKVRDQHTVPAVKKKSSKTSTSNEKVEEVKPRRSSVAVDDILKDLEGNKTASNEPEDLFALIE